MDESSILVDARKGYRVITLNRPQRLNSFTEDMHVALKTALDDAEADSDLPRADDHRRRPRLLRRPGSERPARQARRNHRARRHAGAILQSADPPIARAALPGRRAVNGIAAGAGANIALACDIVVASQVGDLPAGLRQDRAGAGFRRHLVSAAAGRPCPRARTGAARRSAAGGDGRKLGPDLEMRAGRRTDRRRQRIVHALRGRADLRAVADQARARRVGNQRPVRPARSRARFSAQRRIEPGLQGRRAAPSWKSARRNSPARRDPDHGRGRNRARLCRCDVGGGFREQGARHAADLGRARPRGAGDDDHRQDGQRPQYRAWRLHLHAGRFDLRLRLQHLQPAHGGAALRGHLHRARQARRPPDREGRRAPARRPLRHL